MEIGMIGLGRMGGNMAQRLIRGGHTVAGFDFSADVVAALEKNGGQGHSSLDSLVQATKSDAEIESF